MDRSASLNSLAQSIALKKGRGFADSLKNSGIMQLGKGYMDEYNYENKDPSFQAGQAMQFSPIGIGSIGIKGALKASKALPEIGNFLNKAGAIGKAASKVQQTFHPEDIDSMIKFIDEVRLRKPKVPQVGIDAAVIAENYGLRMPKTNSGLANVFDAAIANLNKRK